MKIKILIGVFFATTFLNSTVDAESVSLTLEESIQLALQNNHAITQGIDARDYAKWDLSSSRRRSGPALTYNFAGNRISSSTYEQPTQDEDDFSHQLRLSIPLYTGGQLENLRRQKMYALNSADLNLENTRQEIKLNTTQAYYQILRCRDIINLRTEEVNALQEHLNRSMIQYQEGVIARSDILASTVQLADAQQNLVTAQGDFEKAIASLNNIVGLPIDTELNINDSLKYVQFETSLEDCIEFALENRPDYISAQYAVKQTEHAVKESKAGYRPNVEAAVTKSIQGNDLLSSDKNRSWQAGISVSWNVFNNYVTSSTVHQAESQYKNAKSQYNQARDNVILEVKTAYVDLRSAEENIRTTQMTISQAIEDYDLAQIRYVEGVGTNLDVLDAQEKLTQARINYYTALYNYNTAEASLNKSIGVPVDINVPIYVTAEQDGKSSERALEESALNR